MNDLINLQNERWLNQLKAETDTLETALAMLMSEIRGIEVEHAKARRINLLAETIITRFDNMRETLAAKPAPQADE